MARRSLRLIAAGALLLSAAAHGARQNVIEGVEAALQKDEGLTDEGRRAVVAAIRERFADYALKVVRPDESDLRVLLRMVVEGTFDNAAPERIAEVAFAAYQAVSRGADPDVVEGIGLYGYRKQIPGETLAVWANGYNEAAQGGVPGDVGADLVRNAMEHDWDTHTFNTFKWSLVEAQRRGFDVRRYAAFMFQRSEKGERPGSITATATNTFSRAKEQGGEVPIPDYHGVFVISKEPPAQEQQPQQQEQEQGQAERTASPERIAADQAAEREKEAQARLEAARKAVEEAKAKAERKKAQAAAKAAEKARKKAEKERLAAEKKARAAEQREADRRKAGAADTSGADAEEGGTRMAPLGNRAAAAKLSAVWPDLNAAVRRYLGTPYVWGGETKRGIDCSGLTKRSYFEGAKIGLPRNSRQQWKTGQRVDFDKLQEGDLVFFNTLGNGVSHVGMLVDAQHAKFIHASSSRGVIEDDLGKQWFRKRYLGARRVLKE